MSPQSLREYAREASVLTLGDVACLLSGIEVSERAPERWSMHFRQLVAHCQAGKLIAARQPEVDPFIFLVAGRTRPEDVTPRKLVYTSASPVTRDDLIEYFAKLGALPDWLKPRDKSEQTLETLQRHYAAALILLAERGPASFRHPGGAPNIASIQAAEVKAVAKRFTLPPGATIPGLSATTVQAYAKPALTELEDTALQQGGRIPAGD